MAQSTLRRFSAVSALATTIVFICTLGYMVTTHSDLCMYEHMGELDRRAVTVASLLDILPTAGTVTKLAARMATYATTSNELSVSIDGTSTPVPTGSSSTFPFSTTVAAIAGNVTVTERTNMAPSFSCAPLSAGQGLCVLLCYLAVQIGFVQFGNYFASTGRRVIGFAFCAVGFISGIAFIVGMVVLVGSTQRECQLYARAEAMQSTLIFNVEAVGHLVSIDPYFVTNAKLRIAVDFASTAMGDDITLAIRSATFPANSPYYGLLGQGTLPVTPYTVFRDSSRNIELTATYAFLDVIGETIFYLQELPIDSYVLNIEYVSYALTLGLVPYVVVMVACLILLPYPSLGALESGAAGIFPWQWRMSRAAGLVKWAHIALMAFLVVGMCTIGLCAGYGNRAVYDGLLSMIQTFKSDAALAASVATSFLDTLVLITNRLYTDDTTLGLPTEVVTAAEETLLTSWYTAVMGRVGTMTYNSSSLFLLIGSLTSAPSFTNMETVQVLLSQLSSTGASTLLEYATYVDYSFLAFARDSNYTGFNAKLRFAQSTLRPIVNESSTLLTAFDAAWATYSTTVSKYTEIAISFKAQPYTTNDVRSFYTTDQGQIASVTEDSILSRSLVSSQLPPYTFRVSPEYAKYQIMAALATVLPAIILLALLAIGDALCTHYVFGLSRKWVPSNDPTAVSHKIRVDQPRLAHNVRQIIGSTIIVCLVMVVLSSVFYAQAIIDAELRYNEDADALMVAAAQKSLLSAQSNLYSTAFVWTRASLSRSDEDLILAVQRVLSWQDYFSQLGTAWIGPMTTATKNLVISSYTSVAEVTREAVLLCGLRVIAIVYAFDQLTEMMTSVFAPSAITVPALVTCYGDTDATALLQLLLTVYTQLLHKTMTAASAAEIASQISTIGASNPACSVSTQITDMATYLPFVPNLQEKDDRVAVSVLGGMLQNSAFTAQKALSGLTAYAPVVLQQSSHYAIFWMPVLLCWLLLPFMHAMWFKTSDSMKTLQ
jgi:hypothetical protein